MRRRPNGVDGRVKPGQDEPNGPRDQPMRYGVVIEKGERNYSAYVPDLPGCVSVGDTLDEVKAEIRDAIEFHLEGMREDGLPIPKPSSEADYVEVGEQAA
jgi:predicted RNase H-like HicB family nuclease